MKLGLPSLNVLMVFEVAARTLSFKAAAEELFITPPAVSHQIRVLEKELGISLFKRNNRSIELSAAGLAYYREVAPALAQLRQATSRVQTSAEQRVLNIISIPFITNGLLIPNIQGFKADWPNLKVSMLSNFDYRELGKNEIAVAITLGQQDDPELNYEPISNLSVSPICSKNYLTLNGPIDLNNISQHPFITMNEDMGARTVWGKSQGLDLSTVGDLVLDNFQGVLDGVKQDLGVAMGFFPMINNANQDEDIVPIFPDQQCEFGSIYLAYRETDKDKSELLALKKWLGDLIASLK